MKKDKFKDYIKANRRGSRDADMLDSNGFKVLEKVHESEKSYNRKQKYKNIVVDDDDDIDEYDVYNDSDY